MRILVVIPPWAKGPAERAAFARTAASMVAPAEHELLDCGGRASPAGLAASLADGLRESRRCLLLLPTGAEGEQAAALLASHLSGASLGHCERVEVDGGGVTARRQAFGGRVGITLHSDATFVCATLRPDPTVADAPAPVTSREMTVDDGDELPSEALPATFRFPSVEGAPLVVSGGRGIGGDDGFALLARVAAALGAGLAGSLPAVDAGWVPVAHQVGQSGKFVSPRLYFAVAISGTPQHLAGIAPTARIVALNSDRDALIFQRASVGVEGDWREILPLLVTELERQRPA